MLYLIRTFGRRGRSMLKIGYTSDLQKRMENYYHSNLLYERIKRRSKRRKTKVLNIHKSERSGMDRTGECISLDMIILD